MPVHQHTPPPAPECPASLIGRDREWASVIARCQQARAGAGGLLLVSGETGIGKTALLLALREWATINDVRVLWGSHPDLAVAPPMHGLRQAVAQLFAVVPVDDAAAVEEKIRAALQECWSSLWVHRHALGQFLQPQTELDRVTGDPLEPENQVTRLHDLLYRLFLIVSQERPLLLLLDDCHWADAATIETIAYLAELLATQPVLLIGAYRPDEQTPAMPRLHGLALRRDTELLALSRLTPENVIRMAALRGADPAPGLGAALHRLTDGVPFFVEQYLHLHMETGTPLSEESLDGPPPVRIVQLLERRLKSLAADDLCLLQAAAVAGEPFSAEWLALTCEQSLVAILQRLAELERKGGLIRGGPEHVSLGGQFSFHHPLVRRVLYEAMPVALRHLLHGRLAAALEARCDSQPELVFAMAHHYGATGDQQRAAQVLLRAGQRAFSLQAYAEALGYLERALESCQNAASRAFRANLEEISGDTFYQLNELELARHRWQASLRYQDDPLRRSGLYLRMAKSGPGDYGSRHRWRHLQAAVRETDGHPDSAERCRALTSMVQAGSPESAVNRASACEAIRLLRRHPDPHLWVELLYCLAFIRDRHRLRLGRNRRLLRRCVRLAEQCEWWDHVILGRWELAETWRGVDLARAIAEMMDVVHLAECYLPAQSGLMGDLFQTLGRYQLANGEPGQVRCGQQPGQQSREAMMADGAGGSVDVEYAWQAASEEAHRMYTSGCVTDVSSSSHLSRWQRLAQRLGRQTEMEVLVTHLRETFPQTDAPQWLRQPAGDQALLPLSQDVPIRALVWHAVGGDDRHTVRAVDEVEIRPGPEVGLGWLNTAPCLLANVTGDFELQVRIGSSGHPQRAGGIVVWQGCRLLRLGSGIDHIGQVSLCQADGLEMRYVGVGCLPPGPVWLRLCRRQRRYTALVSSDGATWYDCGQLEFGASAPVEAGLFAECNYEYGFPQPFPVQFTAFRLRVDASKTATGTDRYVPLAPPRRSPVYPLPQSPPLFHGMAGQGRVFRAFCERLRQAARSALPLLITGETGTGKELTAQAIHRLSDQQSGPFVPVNVAALPPELIESELFGYKKGAFTGAAANRPGLFAAATGGTLFLDEIGDLPLAQQAKLLRVLDKGEIRPLGDTQTQVVNARCLAATNRDLQRLVGMGQFRDDLFYRLGQPLVVPPLRSRREDIPYLVSHFLAVYGHSTRYDITAEAMQKLLAYDWPGNVRELRGVVEGAIGMSSKGLITVEHLVFNPAIPATPSSRPVVSKPASAEELACLLRQCNGDITALSRRCGVSRKTVYRWFERYRLDPAALRIPAHP